MNTTQPETSRPGHSKFAVCAIRRAEFSIDSDTRMVAVEVSDKAIEIYWVDPAGGLEMFQGYVCDGAIPASTRIRAIEALAAAPFFKSWTDRNVIRPGRVFP
jgi:hypothetical protein